MKKLLKGSPDSYNTILDLIHADFNVQNTNELIRDNTKLFSVLRRASKSKVEAPEVPSTLKKNIVSVPNNNRTLLPSHFYS